MSIKKFIAFGKVLTFLLLLSSSVSAKALAAYELPQNGALAINKAEHSFHKNMLEPQTVHVSITNEHLAKPTSLGYVTLLSNGSSLSTLKPIGKATAFLQDADRCESVSRLLFPFHNFW